MKREEGKHVTALTKTEADSVKSQPLFLLTFFLKTSVIAYIVIVNPTVSNQYPIFIQVVPAAIVLLPILRLAVAIAI